MVESIPKKVSDKNVKDKAVEAALSLAANKPWGSVTFDDIMHEAELSKEQGQEYFDDKSDILAAYGRKIDVRMLEGISSNAADMSHREQIFDIIMERFDIVNENRDSILSILNSFKGDPKEALLSLPHLGRSITRVLEAANIPTDGMMGCLRVTGLTGVYLYVLKAWKDDDSADMAKTMAALDKALDKAEMVYNSLPIT